MTSAEPYTRKEIARIRKAGLRFEVERLPRWLYDFTQVDRAQDPAEYRARLVEATIFELEGYALGIDVPTANIGRLWELYEGDGDLVRREYAFLVSVWSHAQKRLASGQSRESGHTRTQEIEEGPRRESSSDSVPCPDLSRVRIRRRKNPASAFIARRMLSPFVGRSSVEIAEALGVSPRTAQRVLAGLVDEGSAKRVGSARRTRYLAKR